MVLVLMLLIPNTQIRPDVLQRIPTLRTLRADCLPVEVVNQMPWPLIRGIHGRISRRHHCYFITRARTGRIEVRAMQGYAFPPRKILHPRRLSLTDQLTIPFP